MKKYVISLLVFFFTIISQAQWQPDVRLTNDPASSSTSFNNARCVAAGGDSVHVVWYDDRDGNDEIYYKRSSDGGLNWEADIRLTNNTAVSELPSIAVLGSNVYVVWNDFRDGNNEIYFKSSLDAGVNWEEDTRLTSNSAPSDYPSVSVSGSVVNVVWRDGRDGNWEIYYKSSTDEGLTWGSDIRLTDNSSDSFNPSVSAAGSIVHVVWYDFRDGGGEIYYKRSSDAGISWGTDTRLTNNSGSSLAPSISVSDSDVHVVWQDNSDGNEEIYYIRSTDEGMNWGQVTSITNNLAGSYLPSVVVSGLVVHVVWADEQFGNREIFYKRSTDAGTNWEQDIRLTNASEESWLPSISVSDSILHVVWRDERDGNNEIYYKHNLNANVTGIENFNPNLSTELRLEQNYPNPFNPSTVISWQMPVGNQQSAVGSYVKLKVYDFMGKEIRTIVDAKMDPGEHQVTFDATGLPAGVYFYRLEGRGESVTKKLLLIK
jgi:hypothetical protein